MTNIIHAQAKFAERRDLADNSRWTKRKARLCPPLSIAMQDRLIHRALGSDDGAGL